MESSLLALYYAFIYPYFTFCNIVWGNTCSSYLEPLKQTPNELYEPYVELGNMTILTHHFSSQVLYRYFSGFCTTNENVHNYYARQTDQFHIQLAKSPHRSRTLRYAGVEINNYFINGLNYNCSDGEYKRNLK